MHTPTRAVKRSRHTRCSLARKLATADSTLAQTSETSGALPLISHDTRLTAAAAQTQLYAASVSTITLSLPQSGARVAETRECAKSAADAATAALASVMQAKAELHRYSCCCPFMVSHDVSAPSADRMLPVLPPGLTSTLTM